MCGMAVYVGGTDCLCSHLQAHRPTFFSQTDGDRDGLLGVSLIDDRLTRFVVYFAHGSQWSWVVRCRYELSVGVCVDVFVCAPKTQKKSHPTSF